MALSETDSEPTSVFSDAGGTRCVRSPAAIFAAVFSMRFSGDSVLWVISVASRAPSMTMATPTMMQ